MNGAVLMQAMAAEKAKQEAARRQYMQPSGSGYSRVGPGGQTAFVPDQPPPPARPAPQQAGGAPGRGGSPQESETQALIREAQAQEAAFQKAKLYSVSDPDWAARHFAPLFVSPETSTPDGGDMFAEQRSREAIKGATTWQSFHDLPPEVGRALYEAELAGPGGGQR